MSGEGNPKAFFGVMDAPLIGALVIIVLLGSLFLVFQGKSDEYECQNQAAQYQRQTSDSSAVEKSAPGPTMTGKGNGNQPNNPKGCQTQPGFGHFVLSTLRRFGRLLRRYSEVVTASFTVVLAVATIKLWGSTNALWRAADAQSKDVKAQIKATEDMAKAAQKSADVAEESLATNERPYVYNSAPPKMAVQIMNRTIKFQCANHGRTPALLRDVWAKIIFATGLPIPPYDFADSSHWIVHTPLSMGDARIFEFNLPEGTTAVAVEGNKNGWETLTVPEGETAFFVVQVSYHEATGERHDTIDCWQYFAANKAFLRAENLRCHSMT